MNVNTDQTYANSAYRSNSQELLPPPRWYVHLNRNGMFDTHLAFGHYAELDSTKEITLQLECEEHRIYQNQEERGEKQEVYCDAKRWRFQNSSNIPHILFSLKMLSFTFIWAAWGAGVFGSIRLALGYKNNGPEIVSLIAFISVTLMVTSLTLYMTEKKSVHYIQIAGFLICTSLVIWLKGSLFGNSEMHISFWLGTLLYFMGAIGFDCLLWLHSKVSRHDGSEFNRVDGMVRFKRRFRRLFVAPFEEFDPVLTLLPSGYGSHDYTITLYHRYTNKKISLATKMHSLGLDKANTLAFWDCLQRYMDITQPLPDLPVLEQSRHLDPVTAAHDASTGRNPRRWRDQALTDWKTSGEKKLNEQLQSYPWQQKPCVIKSRLSEELTIEAWYRAQEAKGIKATPKAEDFAQRADYKE
nr:iron ABC transporter permease [Pseudomonas cichorii]